jgi:hypothetical protein
MEFSHLTWRQLENAIVEYIRGEGGAILSGDGESCLIINDDENVISLSELARHLMDPAS